MSPLRDEPWVVAEDDLPAPARADLLARGFRIELVPSHDRAVGHAQMIRIDRGTLHAGSDPRADGAALAS